MALSPITKNTFPHQAWIALGGNLGDVESYFQAARGTLDQHQSCQVCATSLLYQTPAIGPAGQADYLNTVIAINTQLTPESLLQLLQNIENQHGRVRQEHWGARTLDLDIIAYDALALRSEKLNLPHHEMQNRQFVLKPLCDIAPNWQHPTMQQTAQQLLKDCLDTGEQALTDGRSW